MISGKWRAISNENRRFAILMGSMAATILVAFGLGALLRTPPLAQLTFSVAGAFYGVAATLPLLGFLVWFSKTRLRVFVDFRQSQIELFANIGISFTPLRIVLLATGAGISEEFLFRGVLQSAIDPLWAAIIVPNILFGMLHARTLLYAVTAGLVGIYLAVAFALTGNLLAPVLTHILYDLVALEYTRRAIIKYLSSQPYPNKRG